ncbi:unnamed protein product [Lymnaea stagnalis]|uniref:Peptidase S1 domain-containing protein n=1 Tax=Lymnaea stagnalis TaxID=6523 RepID=A0AAV2IDM8_LYMST
MSSQGNDGECQLEVDFVDEGDLEGRFKSCPKNPDHKQFLSLTSLKLDDLPEHHQTPCSLDFIYYMAQFTVRLVVDFISPDRPCDCGHENTSQDRQCKCLRGNIRHVGSGLVTGLAGPDQINPDVRDSTKSYFILVTAAHVIFDTSEAQRTEIEFFYDDPHDRSSVRKAFGLRVLNTNLEADFSEVLCLTEDHVISEKFNNGIFGKINKISPPILSPSDSSEIVPLIERPTIVEKNVLKEHETVSQDLVFHISHPHGRSKTVTLGNIVSADTRNGHYKIIYRLATCPGSSGGPVFVIPANIYGINYTFKNVDAIFSVPHSRHHGNELNKSSSWTVYFSDHYELTKKPKSSAEDQNHCNKNGFRLSLLDVEDLPLEYRNYQHLHCIKFFSKFTVGIHFLNDSTFDSKNMASGFITRLANDDDIRPDLEDTKKTYFIMATDAHIISDTSQAKKTEINFLCDDLQDMSSARKAFGWRVLNSYKAANVIEVLCVTEDQVISSMLKEHFLDLSTSNPQTSVISMLMDHFGNHHC